jgi:HlyD family secretion protein
MIAKRNALILIGAALLTGACARPDPGLRAAGVVDGQVVTVRALAAGRLKNWNAAPAKDVRKGEILGRIDDARIAAGLEELALAGREIELAEDRGRSQLPALQAKIDYVRTLVERLERLRKDQAVSGSELDKARLELVAAEAARDDVKKALGATPIQKDRVAAQRRALDAAADDLTLRSPVDGVVLETHVTSGETMLPGGAAAEILESASLRVDVYLEERELSRLRLNDRVAIVPDGGDGKEWPGTIIQFGATAEFSPKFTVSEKERGALLYKVRIRIDAAAGALKVGQPVTVRFGRPPA